MNNVLLILIIAVIGILILILTGFIIYFRIKSDKSFTEFIKEYYYLFIIGIFTVIGIIILLGLLLFSFLSGKSSDKQKPLSENPISYKEPIVKSKRSIEDIRKETLKYQLNTDINKSIALTNSNEKKNSKKLSTDGRRKFIVNQLKKSFPKLSEESLNKYLDQNDRWKSFISKP